MGIIDGNGGRLYVSDGQMGVKDPRPGGELTGVEIGFDDEGVHVDHSGGHGEARKQASLDDPAAKYLPKEATFWSAAGSRSALLDLATHSLGLPSCPRTSSRRMPTIRTRITRRRSSGNSWRGIS